MRAPTSPEAVREVSKGWLVRILQQLAQRPLDDLVLYRRDSNGSRLALVLDQPEDQEVENDRPLISPPQEDQPEKNAQIPQTTDRMLIQQTADRMPEQTADRMPEQTADGLMYEGQNKPNIPHTPDPAVSTRDPILLSPNQWLVLNALKDIERQGRITSYRDISTVSSVNFHSVRDSIRVLERVGAMLEKRVVKTPREQGFYVSLNKDLSFTQTSAAKLKGVKRGGLCVAILEGLRKGILAMVRAYFRGCQVT